MKIAEIFLYLWILFSLPFLSSNKKVEEKPNFLLNILSSALDLIPILGNFKCLGETLTGRDLITKEYLSAGERTLSLIGIIPFGNFLKIKKHFKNGQKFFKASQRARKAGKIKNAINFSKAYFRAMKKSNFYQKIFKGVFNFIKSLFKFFGNKEKEEKE